MIKKLILLTLAICTSFLFGCKEKSKYDDKISQLRNDIFQFENEEFKLTAYAEIVETPLVDDGVKGKTEKVLVFKLKNKIPTQCFEQCNISFKIKDNNYSKDFEFKQISTLISCAITVKELPSSSLDVTLTINNQSQAINMQSIKNKSTKSYGDVLKRLKEDNSISDKLKEAVEIRIRLINNNDYDYWFVGIVSKEKTVSFLLDGETLEILARKDD